MHSNSSRQIKVDKFHLLEVLKKNRDTHVSEYKKAHDIFRTKVVKELRRMASDADKGGKVELYCRLQEPQDHTKAYDQIIGMLQMDLDTTVELSGHEYQCYVQDEWEWSATAKMLNSTYIGSTQ